MKKLNNNLIVNNFRKESTPKQIGEQMMVALYYLRTMILTYEMFPHGDLCGLDIKGLRKIVKDIDKCICID